MAVPATNLVANWFAVSATTLAPPSTGLAGGNQLAQ